MSDEIKKHDLKVWRSKYGKKRVEIYCENCDVRYPFRTPPNKEAEMKLAGIIRENSECKGRNA